jgi:hypothetical protein
MRVPDAALVHAVQSNCHIADAAHAADLSLCDFLLQMREFYRWERGLPLGAPLAREAVGAWLAERESHWAALEGERFVPIPVDGTDAFDAFDAAALNARLMPAGLVYGAGLAATDRPGFFLAQLHELRRRDDGISVLLCGREFARGLFAPPAALQGDTIVLRRESLARWLWEKFEAFALRRADGPFKAVAAAYGLEHDFLAALPRLLDEQGETLILHELGEHRVGRRLEPGWATMRLALRSRRAGLLVRAVRDQLADLTVTLPTLLDDDAAASIHFWFAGFDGVRKALAPSLTRGYQAWGRGDGGQALREAIAGGAVHFARLAEQVLALHAQHGDRAEAPIESLLSAPAAVFDD